MNRTSTSGLRSMDAESYSAISSRMVLTSSGHEAFLYNETSSAVYTHGLTVQNSSEDSALSEPERVEDSDSGSLTGYGSKVGTMSESREGAESASSVLCVGYTAVIALICELAVVI